MAMIVNNQNKTKELLLLGIVLVSTLLITFWIFVPIYGIMGSALAIFVSYTICSVLASRWFERTIVRHVITAGVSIALGWTLGYTLNSFTDVNTYVVLAASTVLSFLLILGLKHISGFELKQMVKSVMRKT